MTQPPTSDAELDRATDPEYAAVSTLAVLGMVLGALAVTSFVAVPLLAVPALAVGVSLAAWRRIRRSRGVLVGRRLAQAGLALGLAMFLAGGAYHGWQWYAQHRTLERLQDRSHAIIDDVLARRYGRVLERMPPEAPQRKTGADLVRSRLTGLFAGAGDLRDRRLRSLQILRTERGRRVALANVLLRLEYRELEFTLCFQPDNQGRWQFIGLGGRETFISASKHDGRSPPPLFAPFDRG